MSYKWKGGARLSGNPETAGERLESIRTKHKGRLTPAMVVEDAHKKRSPLRDYFEWNDTEAAVQFRIVQAQELIRSIVVVYENAPDAKPVRAFVTVIRDDEPSYTSIEHAMSEPELYQQVLNRAKSEARTFAAKYADLQEFAAVIAAINKVAA